MIAILPAEAPDTDGLKFVVKFMDWPAPITCPADNPLRLKPVPMAFATEMVTAPVPVLAS